MDCLATESSEYIAPAGSIQMLFISPGIFLKLDQEGEQKSTDSCQDGGSHSVILVQCHLISDNYKEIKGPKKIEQ